MNENLTPKQEKKAKHPLKQRVGRAAAGTLIAAGSLIAFNGALDMGVAAPQKANNLSEDLQDAAQGKVREATFEGAEVTVAERPVTPEDNQIYAANAEDIANTSDQGFDRLMVGGAATVAGIVGAAALGREEQNQKLDDHLPAQEQHGK